MLETALEPGVCSMGVDVWLAAADSRDRLPDAKHSADAVSSFPASHNPFQDNRHQVFRATASNSMTKRNAG